MNNDNYPDQNRSNQNNNNNNNNDNNNNSNHNNGNHSDPDRNDAPNHNDNSHSHQNDRGNNYGQNSHNQNNSNQNNNSLNNSNNAGGNYGNQNANQSTVNQNTGNSSGYDDNHERFKPGNSSDQYQNDNFGNQNFDDAPNQRNFNDHNGGNGGNYGDGGNSNNSGNGGQNNNNRNIIIAVLATLAVAVLAYFLFFNKKDKKTIEKVELVAPDTTKAKLPIVDSNHVKINDELPDDEYEEQEYASESYVIANEAYLRSAPSTAPESKIKSMKFGDKVYAKNGEPVNGYTTVYLSKPANEKNITEQPYYLLESTVVSQYEYAQFKEFFSLPPFSTLASKTKKLILEKDYSDGTDYKVSQNAVRAKSSLSYGDFDRDGITDIAIVLDNNEEQISRLLIICTNKATKEPYLAFAENYSDKVRINSFKKGAAVYMSSDEFISSPSDGVIVQGEDIKIALIYDSSNQKFKTYYQE